MAERTVNPCARNAAERTEALVLATEIATVLRNVKRLIILAEDAVGDDDPDKDVEHLMAAARIAVSQAGWAADLITEMLGNVPLLGGAKEWLLPPAYHAVHDVRLEEQARG